MKPAVTWTQLIATLEQFAFINTVLGEKFKVKSYTTAIESLRNEEARLVAAAVAQGNPTIAQSVSFSQVQNLPGIGKSISAKITELMNEGQIKELEKLQSLPVMAAVKNLTTIHGIGPRKAKEIFETSGISTVDALKAAVTSHNTPQISLTDAQLLGLKYADDIAQRIPHMEVAEHDKFLQNAICQTLGDHFTLTICGSYRRCLPTSGDVDALLTIDPSSAPTFKDAFVKRASKTAIQNLVDALSSEYVVGTLASGPTKFMGISKLKGKSVARRIDIRFVPSLSYPTALLYFTGSKSFNIHMRSVAHAKGFILNEYGLYRIPPKGKPLNSDSGAKRLEVEKPPETQRVGNITREEDVFRAIGLPFVHPKNRL